MNQDDLITLDQLKWDALHRAITAYDKKDNKGCAVWTKVAKHIGQAIEAAQKAMAHVQ